jgi:hypothetical protein
VNVATKKRDYYLFGGKRERMHEMFSLPSNGTERELGLLGHEDI